ncbi:PH domain-containing protein [Aeribacillus composti]|uniref:Putative tail tape measure protein n=1 Tax=Anoxybacillus phage A403 TaxID=2099336 RepID=A0A2P1JU00_9CAUD|nr:putative tail tape measure protein [Anoxybacillus phage A403]AVO22621.1 putative tail tape measure protein [Anoxybacillus phage A403]
MGFLKKLEEWEKKLNEKIEKDKFENKNRPKLKDDLKDEFRKLKDETKSDFKKIKEEAKRDFEKINKETKENFKKIKEEIKKDSNRELNDKPNKKSFFKKLLAIEDMSPEEREKIENERREKQAIREKELRELEEKRRKIKEAKLAEQEAKEIYEREKILKFFGSNTSKDQSNYSVYKTTLAYIEENILLDDETILVTIPSEYDKTKNREIKGVLVATDQRLIFATSGIGFGEFVEIFEYQKINGHTVSSDGFFRRELMIDYGRSRKIFDDISDDGNFDKLLDIIRNKSNEFKKIKQTKRTPKTDKSEDKYDKLERLGKLYEQGYLTDEEFQKEKEKILNS